MVAGVSGLMAMNPGPTKRGSAVITPARVSAVKNTLKCGFSRKCQEFET